MEPLKNNISPQYVSEIADSLVCHVEGFDKQNFLDRIVPRLGNYELKERVQLITDCLYDVLPCDTGERNRVLREILWPTNSNGKPAIWGWSILPFNGVIGQHGTNRFEESLTLLKDLTERFSSEFDVRYYLLKDQKAALAIMQNWICDPNEHIRRLVSEGTRPRLPWAMQLPALIEDPSPVLPLLEQLRDDSAEYVRRSVANHLNDIAKDHPDLVANLASRWMIDADNNRKRLLKHACRTLIKNGHQTALEVFGFKSPSIDVFRLSVETQRVQFGKDVAFSAILGSDSSDSQLLVIDYVIHFLKNNGKQAAKVFKWKSLTLNPGETIEISRSHPIKPITTRRYYPGTQGISLRINGQDFGNADFELMM